MINRLLWAGFVALSLAVPAGGCHGLDRYYQGDCDKMGLGLGGRNGVGCCAGGCDDGSCEGGDCSGPACGGCGGCGACCPNPIKTLWRSLTCSSGCGEIYFDEWINDPPEHCDPCDDNGGYIGPQGSCRRWLHGLKGQRGGCGCGACSAPVSSCRTRGCSSCGSGHDQADYTEGEVIEEDAAPRKMEPTPAVETARRPTKQYYTQPTKQASHAHPHPHPQVSAKPQPRVISSSTRTAKLEPTPARR